jgi:hypothetical protein
MKPFQFQRLYESIIGDMGETFVLRRITGPSAGDYTVKGRIIEASLLSANPQISQTKRRVVVLANDVVASGFPTPFIPKQDRIVWPRFSRNTFAWSAEELAVWGDAELDFTGGEMSAAITGVDDTTRRVNGVLLAYSLEIAGA